MSDPYSGVEITETGAGTSVAIDPKAATCHLIATAPVGDVHATVEERAKDVQTDVLIRSHKDALAASGPHPAGYTIPAARDAIFDQTSSSGIDAVEVRNLFDPDVHTTVAEVTDLDTIGGLPFSPSRRCCGHALDGMIHKPKRDYDTQGEAGHMNGH